MGLMGLGVQILALGAAAPVAVAASVTAVASVTATTSAAPATATAPATAAASVAAAASAAAPPAASAAETPPCESQRPQYGDTMQVQCALNEAHSSRRFKFEVRFLGGHDDTRASLSGTLNGKPLACEEGSKPELEGEFGEISIHCQFSSEAIKGAQELKIAVKWYHAQYAEFVLDPL